jgi:hypothetical protein
MDAANVPGVYCAIGKARCKDIGTKRYVTATNAKSGWKIIWNTLHQGVISVKMAQFKGK